MKKARLLIILGGCLVLVAIFFLIQQFFPKTTMKIIAFLPSDGATEIALSPTISVTFSRPASPEEQKQIFFFTELLIKGASEWSGDRKTFTLKPEGPLKVEQKYQLELSYPGKKFSWSFTTKKSEQLTQDEQIQLQAEADRNFAQAQKEILENYPWFLKLPILTDQYFVYFDLEKKIFVAKLYIGGNKSLVEPLKKEVLAALESCDIDTSIYQISWVESP